MIERIINNSNLAKKNQMIRKAEQDIGPLRAEVLIDYKALTCDELSLSDQESVLITKVCSKESKKNPENCEKMYFGHSRQSCGWFPSQNVVILKETRFVERLLNYGYQLQMDLPTAAEWSLITKYASVLQFSKNDLVAEKNNFQQCLYHIMKGSCVKKQPESEDCILDEDSLFGEDSFLLGGALSYSVYADETPTQVCVIDPKGVNIIFGRFPTLGGRFFKLLAALLDYNYCSNE